MCSAEPYLNFCFSTAFYRDRSHSVQKTQSPVSDLLLTSGFCWHTHTHNFMLQKQPWQHPPQQPTASQSEVKSIFILIYLLYSNCIFNATEHREYVNILHVYHMCILLFSTYSISTAHSPSAAPPLASLSLFVFSTPACAWSALSPAGILLFSLNR